MQNINATVDDLTYFLGVIKFVIMLVITLVILKVTEIKK